MKKKLTGLFLLALAAVTLIACNKKEFQVKFDSQGGSLVDTQVHKKNELVDEPEDPIKAGLNFVGWYTTKELSEGKEFNFNTTKLTSNLTLYGVWSDEVVVRFDTKTSAVIPAKLLGKSGGTLSAPTAPAKDGFVFKGWYYGRAGKTWLEETAVALPLEVNSSTRLYAYWEPIDSKTVNWSKGETYLNSFTELTADPVLNPAVYTYSHESSLINYLSTDLYGTDINWDQAIKDGLATEKGDLSGLSADNIGSILREDILIGAAQFPIAMNEDGTEGEDGTGADGKLSEAIARTINAKTYRFKLRSDIKWEDGTSVTAEDYLYSYFTYLDPIQNNFRASGYYPTADRTSGMRIVNARGYFLQGTKIGGETDDVKLAADYSKYRLSVTYNNGASTLSQVGSKYLTLSEAEANSLVLGENDVIPGFWPALDGYVSDYPGITFKMKLTENTLYAGEKGTLWPAVTKEEVGFKVIDDYTFEMTFEVATAHSSAMAYGDFKLVHKDTYEKSLDKNKTNSTYGTSVTKPVSYGAYVLKSWDTGQKIVLNKNYNAFTHVLYNYKSISFEFYSNVDLKMQAFKSGDLSVTGLNQTYYAEYYENPTKQDSHRGTSHYMLINTNSYAKQDAKIVSILQDKDFRQALFFGFNRIEYTKTIFAPNVPSFTLYGGINNTQYDNDPEWYTHTAEYNQMLVSLGIDEKTFGYDPTKAVQLFNAAYDRWVAAEGVTGPLKLNYLTEEGAEQERIDNYIIEHYEKLFAGKIKIVRDAVASNIMTDRMNTFQFDITLSQVGYGSITNTSVMAPVISLFAKDLGLKFGFNSLEDLNIPESVFVIDEANKLDLRSTWNFLKANRDKFDENTDEQTLMPFFKILEDNNGYFVGDLNILYEYGLECTFIWAGLVPQYDGDVDDRNTVTRAFDKIALEWVPIIPIASLASAIVYADNVVNTWPAYHNILQWGQARYSYLNTDSDFKPLAKNVAK